MPRIDVRESRELKAAILALRAIDTTISKKVRQYTKAVAQPEWRQELTRRASTGLERRVIADTAVISVSNQNVRAQSASKGRPLSGGLNPRVDYPGVEFGSHAHGVTYRRRSPRGTVHTVTRVMGTQFKAHNRRGYVFYPAAAEMIPRLASLFAQTTVKTIANALEGKRE